MNTNCQTIVFSNRAYNAIIRESFAKDPLETGGILLGHILNNGVWIVMEVLPPGINCIFQYAYFEYDYEFVNYLAKSVATQYKKPLDLLGLWHRHPGSMDVFSSTDDGTNRTFARQNPYGVISGIVNIDPRFRMTMYHLGNQSETSDFVRPAYENVDFEIGDDIIPDEYFELRYYDRGNEGTNPLPPTRTQPPIQTPTPIEPKNPNPGNTGKTSKVIKWLVISVIAILILFGFTLTCTDKLKGGKKSGGKSVAPTTENIVTYFTPSDSLSANDSSSTTKPSNDTISNENYGQSEN